MDLRIFRSSSAASIREMTSGASGFDLAAAIDLPLILQPFVPVVIPTGIHVAIPQGFEGHVRPRSSLNKAGIHVGCGTIDSDYRGEVGITAINLTLTPYEVRPGDRLAQLVFASCVSVNCTEVQSIQELGETTRGTGSFGSTGR